MSKSMTELDRIVLEFYLDLQPDNYDEAARRFKRKMKALMVELIDSVWSDDVADYRQQLREIVEEL